MECQLYLSHGNLYYQAAHNRLAASPTPAGPTNERPPDRYFGQEVLFIREADYSECDRSLHFNFDAFHLDLRAVVVRHITE
jgi:hypothetical protein